MSGIVLNLVKKFVFLNDHSDSLVSKLLFPVYGWLEFDLWHLISSTMSLPRWFLVTDPGVSPGTALYSSPSKIIKKENVGTTITIDICNNKYQNIEKKRNRFHDNPLSWCISIPNTVRGRVIYTVPKGLSSSIYFSIMSLIEYLLPGFA